MPVQESVQEREPVRQLHHFEGEWTENRDLSVVGRSFTQLRLRRSTRPLSGRILDLGAGNGQASKLLAEAGLDVVSLDFTQASCVAIGGRGGSALRGDGTRLPFAADSFDGVVLLDVIEHMPSPHAVLAECARVLKPGGTLLVSCPNHDTNGLVKVMVRARFGQWPTRDNLQVWDPTHYWLPTIAELRALLEGAGFVVEDARFWARSAFVLGFGVLNAIRRRLRGGKTSKVGLTPARLDAIFERLASACDRVDNLLVMDTPSGMVVTARKPG